MAINTVKDFILEWNKSHSGVKFAYYKVSGTNRPVSVEIRYPELSAREACGSKDWNMLNVMVEEASEGTMVVTTDERSFKKGIIQLMISSRHSNFDERRIVWALEKIGEYLEL